MVAWNELSGSPKYDVRGDGSAAERRGLVSWQDLDALLAQIFPSTADPGATGQPSGEPFPDRPYLRAESLQVQPFGERIIGPDTTQDFATTAQYEQALVTVRYATPKSPQSETESQDDGDPVPFLKHRWSVGGEFVSLPAAGLQWGSSSDAVSDDLNAGLFVPTIEHEINVPQVVSPPFAAIRECIGTVNDAPLAFSTGLVGVETLLFLGAQLERAILSNGQRAWDLTYRFSERRVYPQDQDVVADGFGGWNHFWMGGSADGGWFRLLRKSSTEGDLDLFRRTSFGALFLAEPS